MNETKGLPERELNESPRNISEWLESLPSFKASDMPRIRQQFDVRILAEQLKYVLRLLSAGYTSPNNEKATAEAACALYLLKENLGISNSASIALLLTGKNCPELEKKSWYKPTNFFSVTMEKLTA